MVSVRALVLGDSASIAAPDVEVRSWRSVDVALPGGFAGRPHEAFRLGLATLDTSPLLWADVLVVGQLLSDLARTLVDAVERDPSWLRGRALVRTPAGPGDWRAALATPRAQDRIALRQGDAAVALELQTRPSPAADGLVSVVLAVVDEPAEVVDRAIASALDTSAPIEVVVAGGVRPRHEDVRWIPATGSWAERYVAATDAASGDWIAPLDPASVFAERHVATLLEVATAHDLDAVYGRTLLVEHGEVAGVAGAWPPSPASLAHDAVLYRAALRGVRPDLGCAAEGDDPRWNLWRRWLELGVRIANVEEPVTLRDLSIGAGGAALGDAA